MNHHHLPRAVRVSKPAALRLAFLASAVAFSAAGLVSSTAQSPQQEEREFEYTSPKHMPIKIKVKNEERIKDLKNENWARELEIEVENTGAKPIYFISFSLGVPEWMAPGGKVIGQTFHYGRINLIDYTVKPGPEDTPLLPGATSSFKIPEQNLKAWEVIRAEHPNVTKLRFRINYINFGDGTGLLTDGTPLPPRA